MDESAAIPRTTLKKNLLIIIVLSIEILVFYLLYTILSDLNKRNNKAQLIGSPVALRQITSLR
ncbi:MAG TPA: hypothetical protein DCG88_25770 [Sphingobacterium sp.]|nr:hypothetical protein [Sphingobacterium sp.]